MELVNTAALLQDVVLLTENLHAPRFTAFIPGTNDIKVVPHLNQIIQTSDDETDLGNDIPDVLFGQTKCTAKVSDCVEVGIDVIASEKPVA